MAITMVRDVGPPGDLADVSPGWLSTILSRTFPGVEVESVDADPLHQGTASTWRLRLQYRAGGAVGPATICIKSDYGLPHKEDVASSGLYRKEARVYLDILPLTSARIAQCYAAGYDDDGRGFILMSDLVADGATFCDPRTELSIDQVATGVEQLAELHAATWDAEFLHASEWMHHGVPLSEQDPYWNQVFDRYDDMLEYAHAGAMAKVHRNADSMKRAFNRLRRFDDKFARCLIHGDAHVGNFFVDGDGGACMADFQCVQRGHFAHDLAMFMGTALDLEDRRAHERNLLEHYLNYLSEAGVSAPGFDEAWNAYRGHYIYSLFVWLATTDTFQPPLFLVKNVFRYSMAALDLDALEMSA